MKQLILMLLLTGSIYQSFGQANAFPSSGSVGIGTGTTTPATKLEVVVAPPSTQTDGIRLKASTTLSGNFLATGSTHNSSGVAGSEIWVNSNGGNLTLGPISNHAIKFVSQGAEKMRLLSNGNLGIGTIAPSTKLSLGTFRTTVAGNVGGIALYDTLNTKYGLSVNNQGFLDISANQATSGGIRFFNGTDNTAPTERMRITHTGNVGIGTIAPTTKLSLGTFRTTVAGNVGGIALYDTFNTKYGLSANNQGFLDISANQASSGGIRFFNGTDNTAPTERMRITHTGNVGIGTIAPTTKLSLGTFQTTVAGNVGGIALYETGNTKYGLSVNNQGFLDISGNQATSGGIRFFNGTDNTAPTERMRITSSGNVGIGITNPQAKLAVNGTIQAKKVKVTTSGWADFVFEKNYVLKPLSEVEAFIIANKHLPEVPSASEVANNDLDLGEMNKVLLQKVEELTLYLIAMEKENKLQKERVNNLERLVNSK
jgi:hypothetical protein